MVETILSDHLSLESEERSSLEHDNSILAGEIRHYDSKEADSLERIKITLKIREVLSQALTSLTGAAVTMKLMNQEHTRGMWVNLGLATLGLVSAIYQERKSLAISIVQNSQ